MGSEWERKRAEAYKKRLDKKLVTLGTPNLFTQEPQRAPRIAAADIMEGARLKNGETLVIQKIGNKLALMSGLKEVGQLRNPHTEIISAVEKSFGVAKGVVKTLHEDACVAEISVC